LTQVSLNGPGLLLYLVRQESDRQDPALLTPQSEDPGPMHTFLVDRLTQAGLAPAVAFYLAKSLLLVLTAALALGGYRLLVRSLIRMLSRLIQSTSTQWDDFLLKNRVLERAGWLFPALVVHAFAPSFLAIEGILRQGSRIWMVLVVISVVSALLNTGVDIYNSFEMSRNRPIRGFVQVLKIVLWIYAGAFVLSLLLDKSPLALLSGLGAMTAVLLLIFKDSILGLVAGIQLSSNDMVRIGDWIVMDAFGADGIVTDISLITVKVQNWDKTITTIPAYSMVSGSFRNWRGMTESGGRRIMRSLRLDMQSVHFCTPAELDRYEGIGLIRDYVNRRRPQVLNDRARRHGDPDELINGRAMTNLGTFRAYVDAYLAAHPGVHPGMTRIVRQLQPGEHGLPLEIYVFSRDTAWEAYESLQADLFDHLLAALPVFGLRVFQAPGGGDLREGLASLAGSSMKQGAL
jgi:miniconductance mechanosensitive channel